MRVLHLIPTLGGGGAERQIAALTSGLRALACDVHVGIVSGGAQLARVEAAGATIHRISTHGNYDPLLPLRIARLIRSVRPDVVQTWLTQMDVVGGIAAMMTRTPWVLSERTNKVYYPRDAKHGLRHFVGRFARAIVANSPGGVEYWTNARVPKTVIPNALPLAEIDAAPRDASDFGAREVLLFAGRFDAAKNLPHLIDALAKVVHERDAVALLCGEGPLEHEVRARIAHHNASDRIRLLGFRSDVWSLMKRTDVLVAPSWFEGQPNAVLEAIACGCPLVVSDIPGHRAFLDDSSALFAPPDDADALSRAITHALDDRDAARARAANARERINEWTIGRVSAAYVRVYQEALS
ncbi:MAG TPA: glycosyltransferase [Thermoanaerobaculia bacterium]|nr:glycosyltransferase [Thermoanaerobaculia bacterium]